MPTDFPIRISEEASKIIKIASKELEINSKKNVATILIKAGAIAKGISIKGDSKN